MLDCPRVCVSEELLACPARGGGEILVTEELFLVFLSHKFVEFVVNSRPKSGAVGSDTPLGKSIEAHALACRSEIVIRRGPPTARADTLHCGSVWSRIKPQSGSHT